MPERKRGPKPREKPAPIAPAPGLDPPADLDPDAKKHWKEAAARLADAGLLSELDSDALHLYCSLWSQRRAALAEVKKKGTVIKAPNGYLMANPWYTIAVQCQKDMRPYLDMFGFSPKSRSKIHVASGQAEEADEFAEFD